MKKSNKVEVIQKKKEFLVKIAHIAFPAFALLSMGFNNPFTTNSISDLNQYKKGIINKSDISKNAQTKTVSNFSSKGSCPVFHIGYSGCGFSCMGCKSGCSGIWF